MKKLIQLIIILSVVLTVSCKKDEEPGGSIGQTKTIQWEVFHEFETDENVQNYAISNDAKWLFYANDRSITRIDKSDGTKKVLFSNGTGAPYVHFIKDKLYMFYERNYSSYFAVSSDFGETITEHLVGTYTNVAAGWYDGPFMRLFFNRLFVMPNGDLIFPYIFGNPNNYLHTESARIAVSTDEGATWTLQESNPSYIMAQQDNRLFAIKGGWQGDFGIGESSLFLYSDDKGTSWQASDLKYAPQATDRQNNLVAAGRNEIQRLKGGRWTIYTWERMSQPIVDITTLANSQAGTSRTRRVADIEFDAANNMYVMGSDNKLCRTKLD